MNGALIELKWIRNYWPKKNEFLCRILLYSMREGPSWCWLGKSRYSIFGKIKNRMQRINQSYLVENHFSLLGNEIVQPFIVAEQIRTREFFIWSPYGSIERNVWICLVYQRKVRTKYIETYGPSDIKGIAEGARTVPCCTIGVGSGLMKMKKKNNGLDYPLCHWNKKRYENIRTLHRNMIFLVLVSQKLALM